LISILVFGVTRNFQETPPESLTNTDFLLGSTIEMAPFKVSGLNESHRAIAEAAGRYELAFIAVLAGAVAFSCALAIGIPNSRGAGMIRCNAIFVMSFYLLVIFNVGTSS
jgi:hypothetical protein